jgi:hypothetical protein
VVLTFEQKPKLTAQNKGNGGNGTNLKGKMSQLHTKLHTQQWKKQSVLNLWFDKDDAHVVFHLKLLPPASPNTSVAWFLHVRWHQFERQSVPAPHETAYAAVEKAERVLNL